MMTRHSCFHMLALVGLLFVCGVSSAAQLSRDILIGPPLKGAWFNAEMTGQGFFVEVYEEPPVIFMGWFTFPREGGEAGDLAHRWYTIQGEWSAASTVEATIYLTTGGDFLEPLTVLTQEAGSATIRFTGCNSGELAYRFDDNQEQGLIQIQRVIPTNESECEELIQPEPAPVPEQVEATETTVFMDVSLLEMPAGLLRKAQMVVVAGGEIVHVGPSDTAQVPEEAVVIDGHGRYLVPGMVDTHTHLATNVREFFGLNAPEERVEESARNQLVLYLARGVTSILNNGDFGERLPRWGNRVIKGDLVGPTVYAAQYSRGSINTPDGGPPGREILNANQARSFTRNAQAEGYQFMKIYNHTPRDGALALMDEAEKLGMPVLGHFPQTMSTQETLNAGLDMVAHSGAFLWRFFNNNPNANDAQIQLAVGMTINAGASVSATVGLEELVAQIWCNDPGGVQAYWDRPETRYMHPSTVSLNKRSITAIWRWNPTGCSSGAYQPVTDFIQRFTRALHDGGATVLMGSDSPTVLGVPGFSAIDEVQALVNSGISLPDALRIATWNGGQFISNSLGLAEPFGAIRPGWRADMVLLGSDPLVSSGSLDNVVGVMARGRWKSGEWFDAQLEAIATSYGN